MIKIATIIEINPVFKIIITPRAINIDGIAIITSIKDVITESKAFP